MRVKSAPSSLHSASKCGGKTEIHFPNALGTWNVTWNEMQMHFLMYLGGILTKCICPLYSPLLALSSSPKNALQMLIWEVNSKFGSNYPFRQQFSKFSKSQKPYFPRIVIFAFLLYACFSLPKMPSNLSKLDHLAPTKSMQRQKGLKAPFTCILSKVQAHFH